jgi:hypothetical protein
MKKNHFFARPRLSVLALLAGTMLVASCAVDGYDDETFSGGVNGQSLSSPEADKITFAANADGSKTTITWPVVYGAGGFLTSLYDVTDPSNPVLIFKDSLIDGSTMSVPRAEDTNYEFSIQTMGNENLGNVTAENTTKASFTTFLPAFAVVPDGSDLTEWFAANPLPADQHEVAVDLVAGGHYTMSGDVDFNTTAVTLRTASTNRALIALGATSSFITTSGLRLKNLIIDGAAASEPLIELSATPDESLKDKVAVGKGYYFIQDPFSITNCLIENFPDEIINNNKVQYSIETFLIENSVFHFATGAGMSSASYFNMYNNGAGINDFIARKSTFYNSSENDPKYFMRYNNSYSCKRTNYDNTKVTFEQCTFYNIVKKNQFANYDGLRRNEKAIFTLTSNIFVNTGNTQFVRRYLAGGGWADAGEKNFTNNTYVMDGADAWTMPDASDPNTWTGEASYDRSGTIVSGDPGFKDAANGDFTVTGANQIAGRIGDPRWLPAE